MATPQEIEIKFLVPDLKALEKKLRELGFYRCSTPSHSRNQHAVRPAWTKSCDARANCCACVITVASGSSRTNRKPSRDATNRAVNWRPESRMAKRRTPSFERLGFRRRSYTRSFARSGAMINGQRQSSITPRLAMSPRIEGKSRWIDRIARKRAKHQQPGLHHQILC